MFGLHDPSCRLSLSALLSLRFAYCSGRTRTQVINIGKQDLPGPVKALMRAPLVERMIAEIFQIFIMTPKDVGSFDLEAKQEALVY